MTSIRIELNDKFRTTPQPRSRMQRYATSSVAIGILLVALAVTAMVVLIIASAWSPEILVGSLILGGFGALMVSTGLVRRRWVKGHPNDEFLSMGAPYAFEFSEQGIVFPEHVYQAAEAWQWAETTTQVRTIGKRRWLVLRHPGHRTRRYPEATLATDLNSILLSMDQVRAPQRP